MPPRPPLHVHAEPGLLTWPMGLTMLRLALLPVFLALLLYDAHSPDHTYRHLTLAIFAVMAVTDKLDGYLARRLNQVSKLGTLLDPVADKILIACSVILLSFQWIAPEGYRIPVAVVVAVYGKDLIVAAGSLALLSLAGKVTVSPRWPGKISTFLQLSLIIATILAPDLPHALGTALTRALWVLVIATALIACVDYIIQGFVQLAAARRERATTA